MARLDGGGWGRGRGRRTKAVKMAAMAPKTTIHWYSCSGSMTLCGEGRQVVRARERAARAAGGAAREERSERSGAGRVAGERVGGRRRAGLGVGAVGRGATRA